MFNRLRKQATKVQQSSRFSPTGLAVLPKEILLTNVIFFYRMDVNKYVGAARCSP